MKKRIEKVYHYDVVFDPNGDGYTVTAPGIPGLVTEGSTLSEARLMAKDAIRCALEAVLKEKSFSSRTRPVLRRRIAVGM